MQLYLRFTSINFVGRELLSLATLRFNKRLIPFNSTVKSRLFKLENSKRNEDGIENPEIKLQCSTCTEGRETSFDCSSREV